MNVRELKEILDAVGDDGVTVMTGGCCKEGCVRNVTSVELIEAALYDTKEGALQVGTYLVLDQGATFSNPQENRITI